MPTVVLIRHGRTAANTAGILAGRDPGLGLDDLGQVQAEALAGRLAGIALSTVVTGPLRRCRETAAAIVAHRQAPAVELDGRLTECDYGDWTGRPLKELARERLWRVVQAHPSAVTFPGGESMHAVQARAVDAIREYDRRVATATGPEAVWAAVSHGDVIKSVVADALGMHLDLFQRLVVDPGAITVVRYTDVRPFVIRLNDTGDDLAVPQPRRRRRRSSDAVVGGGAGRS